MPRKTGITQMGERAAAARNRALSQAPKREAVPTPFWSEDDGYVYLEDVPADEITQIQQDSTGQNGLPDTARAGAAMLCKALMIKEDDGTYSPMFTYPDDVGTVAHLGTSLLFPVFNQANAFFGFTPDAIEQAKNGSGPMLNSSGGIGSVMDAIIVP